MKKIRVFICEDHKVFIEGLIRILKEDDQIEIIGYALNGDELFQRLDETLVDIVIMDISIGNSDGVELTRLLKAQYPGIKVIALTMYEDSAQIERMVSAGAGGYLFKNTTGTELITAIKAVHENSNYFSSAIVNKLIGHKSKPGDAQTAKKILSDREMDVLRLIIQEKTNREIAELLFLSIHTVNSHRKNILSKLEVKTTVGLIKFALENNLI